jgi:predicted anti-sigma-YlaC factor YlaD
MSCRRYKKIILADYLDDRLPEAKKVEIDAHLAVCADCRELVSLATKVIREPFRKEKKAAAPEYLWHRIQAQISQDKAAPVPVLEQLKERLSFLHPAFALGIVIIFMIVSFAAFHAPSSIRSMNEQAQYLYDLASGAGGYATEASKGYGTRLEKFLL